MEITFEPSKQVQAIMKLLDDEKFAYGCLRLKQMLEHHADLIHEQRDVAIEEVMKERFTMTFSPGQLGVLVMAIQLFIEISRKAKDTP